MNHYYLFLKKKRKYIKNNSIYMYKFLPPTYVTLLVLIGRCFLYEESD